ncbi:hypothetical protein SLEP1_g52733 [Rubroshorea leprosula]|uniref:Uncharacterized protein n=1 Tax=Rubroshorea leprosula TaxID=152421 RepID=A0AAV5M7Z8_9ROSI|nr:hypothetical protein SLEP1_g52733 [Rubroshorea leprosula]
MAKIGNQAKSRTELRKRVSGETEGKGETERNQMC